MQIHVKNKDYGFFSEQPITVTRLEDGEIVYCNHAQAVEEEFSQEFSFNDGTYVEVNKSFLKCYKCGAFKDLTYLNNDWEYIDD